MINGEGGMGRKVRSVVGGAPWGEECISALAHWALEQVAACMQVIQMHPEI